VELARQALRAAWPLVSVDTRIVACARLHGLAGLEGRALLAGDTTRCVTEATSLGTINSEVGAPELEGATVLLTRSVNRSSPECLKDFQRSVECRNDVGSSAASSHRCRAIC
jgi:hypothetical protein